MNKKYIVDQEGKVTVVTENGTTIEREDKYTKNTDEILSLENALESIENKINFLNKRLTELKNKKKNNKIGISLVPIILLALLGIILPIVGIIFSSAELALIIGSCVTLFGVIAEIVQIVSLIKNNSKKNHINQRIVEESERKNRVKKRIDTLSKDKIRATTPTTFTDVKQTYEFNFSASNQFVERYTIDKRAKQMTHSKKKKRIRKFFKKNNSMYEI